jgi:hypothetical protein
VTRTTFTPERLCRPHVDVVEAGGARRNKLRAAGGEMFQHAAVDDIVDEDADGREPRRQRCRTGPEGGIEIDELVSVTGVQLVERRALVTSR